MLIRQTLKMNANLISHIGNTPLLPLEKVIPGKTILAKAEMFNPGGSVKDRLAISLIEAAERDGRLKHGGTVIEVTSGNTGISVAWICAVKNYRAVIVMSDKNSKEKQDMMRSYGAELILTPHTVQADDPRSSYKTAEKLAGMIPDSIYLDQYNNPANIRCHYDTTGPEIWKQTDGEIDCLIAGAGTGGTISGVARYLKEKKPTVKIVAVDSEGSVFGPYFETGKLPAAEHYEIEGIGGDKLVEALDFNIIDRFVTISDRQAFSTSRKIAGTEGIFSGGSSGAVIAAADQLLKDDPGISCPVVIMADSGNRYLSKIYNDSWMKNLGFLE